MRDNAAAKSTLKLFHQAAREIPAYKDFLQKEGVHQPKNIKTIDDFRKYVPVTDKKNYISQYSPQMLCWKGDLFTNHIIASSSGTMGQPFFWPRGISGDTEGVELHEAIYREIFKTKHRKTLVVVCFSMGEWVAGFFTAVATMGVADRGHKINVMTPGLERAAALKSISTLGRYYDQVIIAGYPPHIKDIIDEGSRSRINWSQLNTKLLMAGEGISEEWRDYIAHKIHADNPYTNIVNIYGSADATMLGHETPLSILIRRIYNRRPKLRQDLFGTSNLSSLVQYYPKHRYFESVDDSLLVSAGTGIPLIRYNTQDKGRLYTFDELTTPIQKRYQSLSSTLGAEIKPWKQLPFIFLQGRPNSVTTIYSVNVYAENLKTALLDKQIRRWVSGRFTMATQYRADMNQYFVINIELAKDITPKQVNRKLLKDVIVKRLCRLNAEYNYLHKSIHKKAEPKIELIKWGDTEYFARGIKHKWVKKG